MGELLGKKDDDRGYTNLLVHTDKGGELLKEIATAYEIFQVDAEKAIALDGIMVRNSATPHKDRASLQRSSVQSAEGRVSDPYLHRRTAGAGRDVSEGSENQ